MDPELPTVEGPRNHPCSNAGNPFRCEKYDGKKIKLKWIPRRIVRVPVYAPSTCYYIIVICGGKLVCPCDFFLPGGARCIILIL